jgi:hypothetical protein
MRSLKSKNFSSFLKYNMPAVCQGDGVPDTKLQHILPINGI